MSASYEAWVLKHQGWYLSLLDTVRSLSIFFPGRFRSDVSSEGLYGILNVLSLYHERIVNRGDNSLRRFKMSGTENLNVERKVSLLLGVSYYTEVLIEMLASKHMKMTKFGVHGKWFVILAVESFKSLLRLWLLKKNGGRTLCCPSPGDLEEERVRVDGELFKRKVADSKMAEHPNQDVLSMYTQHGRLHTPHGQFSHKHLHPRDKPSFKPTVAEAVGEGLYHLRPVLYVIARIFTEKTGRSKWTPFFVSLGVDALSRLLKLGAKSSLSPTEQAERTKRMMALCYYFIRDPLFDSVLLSPLKSAVAMLGKLPLIGWMMKLVLELLLSLQKMHFYQSGS